MKKLMLVFLFLSVLLANSLTAQNDVLKFDIVNHTGISLYGVYITDTDQNNWGDDIITNDRFEDNTTVHVTVPIDNQTLCDYDIRVADDEQNSIEFTAVDFCELQTITLLTDDNGNLYYTVNRPSSKLHKNAGRFSFDVCLTQLCNEKNASGFRY